MGERSDHLRAAVRSRKMRAHSYHVIKVLSIFVVMSLIFCAGFFLRGQTTLLQQFGLPASITGVTQNSAADLATGKKDVYNSLSARMSEVEDVIAQDSLDTYNLSDATDKTLTAFAESTDDPYMRYYSPDRYAALLNTNTKDYAGIGVLFSEYKGQAYAVDVFEGSQAQLEGVQEGDFIVAINGDNLQSWSRSEVTAALSRSEGAPVIITWRRPTSLEALGGEQFTTTLTCQVYEEVNVTSHYDADRRVGYIKVKQLTSNVASLVQTAIDELKDQGAGAFVLDIRDNPGGYLSQAVALCSLFMNGGTVVEVKTVDGQSAKSATGQPATNLPLVLITNKNTAAAAEVVAAALKENQRATLVGERTMGKGSVQVMHELNFGGALRYTAAYYLTPEGHAIDDTGVTPEVTVANDGFDDNQLDYAESLAASLAVIR